jgi:O-antigen biosynthesis protein
MLPPGIPNHADFSSPSGRLLDHDRQHNPLAPRYLADRLKRWPRTAWRILRVQGFRRLVAESRGALREILFPQSYERWISQFDVKTMTRQDAVADIAEWAARPRISLLMYVGDADTGQIATVVHSIEHQFYPDWQLCIGFGTAAALDPRQYLRRCAEREPRIQIATSERCEARSQALNRAFLLASGNWIATLDAESILPKDALYCMAKEISSRSDADLVFSDEDRIDPTGRRCDPVFKPDWNPALMLSRNAVGQLALFRRDLVDQVGAFRPGFDGQENYDLVLRCTAAAQRERVVHVPRVLYHRQATKNCALEDSWGAGRRAIEQHLATLSTRAAVGRAADSGYQVEYPTPVPPPRVSILVATSARSDLLGNCLDSLLKTTTYPNFEVLLLVNEIQRRMADRADVLDRLVADSRVHLLTYSDRPFNYAWANNWGAEACSSEILCFLNDDTEVITPDWVEKLVARVSLPGVAAAGPMLYYPNDTIQHAGTILGLGGTAGHACDGEPRGSWGYLGRAALEQDVSCVTAACMLVRRNVFRELGGFNEAFAVAYNDVDFCLRIRRAGWRIVWTPSAELYHLESASLGRHDAPHRRAQFRAEVELLRRLWGPVLDSDPFYNPNLSLRRQFTLAFPPRRRVDV